MASYPLLVCKDGFTVSCQASSRNYSIPKNDTGPYEACELGFPSEVDSLILPWAEDQRDPCGTVYGYVPAAVIDALVLKHGGLESGRLPPFLRDWKYSAELAEELNRLNESEQRGGW